MTYPNQLLGLKIIHKTRNRRKRNKVTRVIYLTNKDKIQCKIGNMIDMKKR